MNRRNLFEKFVGVLFGGTVLAFFAPALAFLFPNKNFGATGREFTEANGELISANSISSDGARIGMLGGKPTMVLRRNGELVAFSAVCTHLGCIVAFNASENIFQCPCHGGKYDHDGKVIAGPPPQPLAQIAIKVEEDKIVLS
jgi:cytochrome b6-f complex iron-sulfur subunit